MRVTTEDWLAGKKNPFKFTGSEHPYCGIINTGSSMMIVPLSNKARLDMMTKHGQPYSAQKNEGLMNQVVANPATMYVDNLRTALKDLMEDDDPQKLGLFQYHNAFFDPKLLKVFIKPYRRKMDKLTIWWKGSIMHIVCPDSDWGCFIAPHDAVKEEPKPKTFNPMTGEME